MTVFYLLRHAHHDLLGRELVGRRPDVRLSSRGLRQAAALATALAPIRLDAVLSSPSERARQTAAAIAERQQCDVELAAELDEIDFGTWTGRSFAELASDPGWQRFNEARGRMAPPGGEHMIEVQARGLELIERLAARSAEGKFALTSHGDVIRVILMHYLGVALDSIHRLEVAPASASILSLHGVACRVRGINVGLELQGFDGEHE